MVAIPLYYRDLSVQRVVLACRRGLFIRLQRVFVAGVLIGLQQGFCCSRGVYRAAGRVSAAAGVRRGFMIQAGMCKIACQAGSAVASLLAKNEHVHGCHNASCQRLPNSNAGSKICARPQSNDVVLCSTAA